MINSRTESLVHDQLQGWSLKDGKQLFRHRFRGWQHAGALASGWNNGCAYAWG
jgi:hypothetical protein